MIWGSVVDELAGGFINGIHIPPSLQSMVFIGDRCFLGITKGVANVLGIPQPRYTIVSLDVATATSTTSWTPVINVLNNDGQYGTEIGQLHLIAVGTDLYFSITNGSLIDNRTNFRVFKIDTTLSFPATPVHVGTTLSSGPNDGWIADCPPGVAVSGFQSRAYLSHAGNKLYCSKSYAGRISNASFNPPVFGGIVVFEYDLTAGLSGTWTQLGGIFPELGDTYQRYGINDNPVIIVGSPPVIYALVSTDNSYGGVIFSYNLVTANPSTPTGGWVPRFNISPPGSMQFAINGGMIPNGSDSFYVWNTTLTNSGATSTVIFRPVDLSVGTVTKVLSKPLMPPGSSGTPGDVSVILHAGKLYAVTNTDDPLKVLLYSLDTANFTTADWILVGNVTNLNNGQTRNEIAIHGSRFYVADPESAPPNGSKLYRSTVVPALGGGGGGGGGGIGSGADLLDFQPQYFWWIFAIAFFGAFVCVMLALEYYQPQKLLYVSR